MIIRFLASLIYVFEGIGFVFEHLGQAWWPLQFCVLGIGILASFFLAKNDQFFDARRLQKIQEKREEYSFKQWLWVIILGLLTLFFSGLNVLHVTAFLWEYGFLLAADIYVLQALMTLSYAAQVCLLVEEKMFSSFEDFFEKFFSLEQVQAYAMVMGLFFWCAPPMSVALAGGLWAGFVLFLLVLPLEETPEWKDWFWQKVGLMLAPSIGLLCMLLYPPHAWIKVLEFLIFAVILEYYRMSSLSPALQFWHILCDVWILQLRTSWLLRILSVISVLTVQIHLARDANETHINNLRMPSERLRDFISNWPLNADAAPWYSMFLKFSHYIVEAFEHFHHFPTMGHGLLTSFVFINNLSLQQCCAGIFDVRKFEDLSMLKLCQPVALKTNRKKFRKKPRNPEEPRK